MRTDDAGNTYLLGEIYNDTDVQGSEMTFHATLFDEDHNPLAGKDVTVCPGDLAPHSQAVYSVKFDEPNLPSPASFEVKPIAGKALKEPPSSLDLSIVSASANWKDAARETLVVRLSVKNDGQSTVTPQMCAASYDSDGNVRGAESFDPKLFHADTMLHPGDTLAYDFSLVGQQGNGRIGPAVTARAWLWFPGVTSSTSKHQPLMTEALPISD